MKWLLIIALFVPDPTQRVIPPRVDPLQKPKATPEQEEKASLEQFERNQEAEAAEALAFLMRVDKRDTVKVAQVKAGLLAAKRPPSRVVVDGKPVYLEARPSAIDDDGDGPWVVALKLDAAMITRGTFDLWIYGTSPIWATRSAIDEILERKIKAATDDHHLTGPQVAKLTLAGKGDIQHFYNRIEQKRAEFEAARQTYQAGREFLRQLKPLAEQCELGPFGDDSLFAKILNTLGKPR